MTPPPPGYTVHTKELRDEAAVWEAQSGQLKQVVEKADSLRMNRIQAGIFQLLVTSYGPVIEQVMARCREGQQRTEEIARALREVAAAYEKAEADGEGLFKQKF